MNMKRKHSFFSLSFAVYSIPLNFPVHASLFLKIESIVNLFFLTSLHAYNVCLYIYVNELLFIVVYNQC